MWLHYRFVCPESVSIRTLAQGVAWCNGQTWARETGTAVEELVGVLPHLCEQRQPTADVRLTLD